MKHPVDILSKIQKVDTPPFLYTRILSRIQNKVIETVPVKWAVAATASLVLLISFNLNVILTNKENNTSTVTNTETNLSEAFSLQTSNSLYNE